MRVTSLLLLLALGCASNPAPKGALLPPQAMESSAYGGYILVKHRDGSRTEGELLAARDDRVWVRTARGVSAIPLSQVESMRLAAYQTGQELMTAWGTVGSFTALTHGYWLVFSVPIWILTTGISAGIESRSALVDYPDQPLPAFAQWARYPQGMPVVAPPRPPTDPPLVPKPPP
jgi:hypothetical protein